MEIIKTSAFQRLRRLKQTPSAHYVYPGATHTRFSHSLGVAHLSGVFVHTLLEPLIWKKEIEPSEAQRHFFLIRLWGLTHDLGHGPFSHRFDDIVLKEFNHHHESMSVKILTEDPEISQVFEAESWKKLGIEKRDVEELLTKSTTEEWESQEQLGKSEHLVSAFNQVLLGTYSTDLIDYLLRDSLFTGAGYGTFDWQRLIISSHLWRNELALEERAKESLYAFILARLLMFDTVYYHRTSRAFDKVIELFLNKTKEIMDYSKCIEQIESYVQIDEESLLNDQRLRTIDECKYLINRVNPYSMIDDMDVSLRPGTSDSFSVLALKNQQFLNAQIAERLTDVPEEAYFIDTPSLPLNPMMRNDEICFLDTSKIPPTESREFIHDAFWMPMPYRVYIIRLYLQKKYKHLSDKIKKAFRETLGQKEIHTHY